MELVTKKPNNLFLINGIVIAFLFFPVMGVLVYQNGIYTTGNVFTSRLIIWGEVFLLYIHAVRVEKLPYLLFTEREYKFGFYAASFGALYLLAIGAGILQKIAVSFGLPQNREVFLQMMTIMGKSLPLTFFAAITAGFTEELIFRGYLLPRLELLFKNKYMPVIISSVMFGLVHYRYHSYGEVIFAVLFGVVFAIHYQWCRNIKILVITHACVDLVSFLVFRLALHYHIPLK